jgi:pyrroloquinoline quinone (PQQ) biosynthesis protein C
MNRIPLDPGFASLVRPKWLEALDGSAFLRRCRAGTVTRAELARFVRQHHYYARHFTRYLLALTSNLAEESDRRALMDNLCEEMGLDQEGQVSHAELYRQMMHTMGVELEAEPVLPATQALIDTMYECCRSPRPMVGLGALCLGAEAIVPHLYSTIIAGFESVREPRQNLTFFELHIEADDAHAVTMRRIIERELARHPLSLVDLEYGAARAIAARTELFDALVPRALHERSVA